MGRPPVVERSVGIENSKSLGMVAPPPAIVTEIVAEMVTLGLGNVREQALSWKAGALPGSG